MYITYSTIMAKLQAVDYRRDLSLPDSSVCRCLSRIRVTERVTCTQEALALIYYNLT